jgi:hypothetical protein
MYLSRLFFLCWRVCRKYIEEAYKELLSTDDIKKTILGQYLERKHLYNLSINDVISVMSEFLIGGVDTVLFSIFGTHNML